LNSDIKHFTITVFLFLTINNFPQDIPELVTDRPDRTESASALPKGWLQIESGFEYLKESNDLNSGLNEIKTISTLFRYGLVDNLEIRFAGAFLSQNTSDAAENYGIYGITDLLVGAKYEFISGHNSVPDVGLMAHLFLPVGEENLKPQKVEPEIILSLSKPASDFIDIGTNLGVHYHSLSEEMIYFYTLTAGFGIAEQFGTFAEVFSEFFQSDSPFISLGAGFTYLILQNLQLDVSGGNGLFNNSKVWYLGAGFSVRIPR